MKLAIAIISLVALPSVARAQSGATDERALELAAARASMQYMPRVSFDAPVVRGLNPRIVKGDVTSAELSTPERRDSAATAEIAMALDLIVREPDQVCAAKSCDLAEMSGYLSLSRPSVDGDSAVVSAIVLTPNPRPHAVYYERYRFGFTRGRCGWMLRWSENADQPNFRTLFRASPPDECARINPP